MTSGVPSAAASRDLLRRAVTARSGRDRTLTVAAGDMLAVLSAGAYGMSMASNYNTRPRAAEVMVEGNRHWVVREREDVQDLLKGERQDQGLA